MSRYHDHKRQWIKCRRCELYKTRSSVVLARGKLPCDVLFVGEAPGASEDVIGRPFVGPAGKLLDRMIKQSLPDSTRIAITNLVACIPVDDEGQKIIEPPKYAIAACKDRLQEMIGMSHAKLVVAVGKCAAKYLQSVDCPVVEIMHPAAILRMDVSQQGLAYQRCLVALADAVEEHL